MTKSLVETQFGAHAAAYVTSPVHAKGASLHRLVELTQPRPDWRVLDIATAAGHTALAFAPHVAEVVASDLTEEMLREAETLARTRGITNMTIVRAAADALPFDPESFDLVTCRIAAHHFPDVGRFLREVGRVLKPGGLFALVDNVAPDADSTPGFAAQDLQDAADAYNAFERLRDPSHARCMTLGEWRGEIRAAGLEIGHVERLSKEMEFIPWAERLGASTETIQRLEAMLDGAGLALQAFLRPRRDGRGLHFTLEEALILARRLR